MRMKFWWFGKAVLGVFCVAVLGWVVMSLWNAILPGVFDGIHRVGYWHALGLLILCRLLFGGFRGRGGRGGHMRGRGFGGRAGWRAWEGMSQEEREQFMKTRGSCWSRRRDPRATSENEGMVAGKQADI